MKRETGMKQLFFTVALCFVFAVVGYADGCSDLCNACQKSPTDIRTCCKAESACYQNGAQKCGAAEGKCELLKSRGGDGDDYNNRQHFPVMNERRVRQEIERQVDNDINDYRNFQQQQAQLGRGQFNPINHIEL
jgi:hypothetical protein